LVEWLAAIKRGYIEMAGMIVIVSVADDGGTSIVYMPASNLLPTVTLQLIEIIEDSLCNRLVKRFRTVFDML
jgi:hypothetical protein